MDPMLDRKGGLVTAGLSILLNGLGATLVAAVLLVGWFTFTAGHNNAEQQRQQTQLQQQYDKDYAEWCATQDDPKTACPDLP